ncbi:MAG TPA: STAS domain-containing protein [Acidimicrobiales bacterium]|nr:STAS domain-containing protein [Acidimicrobiales bacterium]
MEFGIGMTSAYGRTTLAVSGDIDAATAAPLRSALSTVAEIGDGEIYVDMAEVTFIESAGLACLLEAHAAATAAGKKLVVVQPSRVVSRLLKEAGELERLSPDPRP